MDRIETDTMDLIHGLYKFRTQKCSYDDMKYIIETSCNFIDMMVNDPSYHHQLFSHQVPHILFDIMKHNCEFNMMEAIYTCLSCFSSPEYMTLCHDRGFELELSMMKESTRMIIPICTYLNTLLHNSECKKTINSLAKYQILSMIELLDENIIKHVCHLLNHFVMMPENYLIDDGNFINDVMHRLITKLLNQSNVKITRSLCDCLYRIITYEKKYSICAGHYGCIKLFFDLMKYSENINEHVCKCLAQVLSHVENHVYFDPKYLPQLEYLLQHSNIFVIMQTSYCLFGLIINDNILIDKPKMVDIFTKLILHHDDSVSKTACIVLSSLLQDDMKLCNVHIAECLNRLVVLLNRSDDYSIYKICECINKLIFINRHAVRNNILNGLIPLLNHPDYKIINITGNCILDIIRHCDITLYACQVEQIIQCYQETIMNRTYISNFLYTIICETDTEFIYFLITKTSLPMFLNSYKNNDQNVLDVFRTIQNKRIQIYGIHENIKHLIAYLVFENDISKAMHTIISHLRRMNNATETQFIEYIKTVSDIHCDSDMHQMGFPITIYESGESYIAIYKQQMFCDISFEVEHTIFHCHKNVLSVSSLYFEKLFTLNMKEKKHTSIQLNEISAKIFDQIIKFIYTKTIVFHSTEDIINLIYYADMYRLHDLVTICEKYLSEYIGDNTLIDIYECARMLKLSILEYEISLWICKHYSRLSNMSQDYVSCNWKMIYLTAVSR